MPGAGKIWTFLGKEMWGVTTYLDLMARVVLTVQPRLLTTARSAGWSSRPQLTTPRDGHELLGGPLLGGHPDYYHWKPPHDECWPLRSAWCTWEAPLLPGLVFGQHWSLLLGQFGRHLGHHFGPAFGHPLTL